MKGDRVHVFVAPDTTYSGPVRYSLRLIFRHIDGELIFSDNADDAHLVFDHDHNRSEPLAIDFYQAYSDNSLWLSHENWMTSGPWLQDAKGNKDLIATIFYMVNCLQERNAPDTEIDQFGRFKYSASYQFKYQCITDNLVLGNCSSLATQWRLPQKAASPSRIHLSHDIDALRGSLLQTSYHLVKHGRFADAIRNAVKLNFQPYDNLKDLEEINDSHDLKTTYFFIPKQGRGAYGIKNADYSLDRMKQAVAELSKHGNEIGLHKSSVKTPLAEELSAMPTGTAFNRYHFLAHQPHSDWKLMEQAGITVDCSLGFAEHYGFRNSYGLPFRPYDPESGEAMKLVISPLHIMDGTLWGYMSMNLGDIPLHLIDFLEKNRENTIISILWHNTSITDIPFYGLRKTYHELLTHISKNQFVSVLCSDIKQEFEACQD